jgi:hypothetical protein
MNEPQFRIHTEFLDHFGHGGKDRNNLMDHPRLIDPHPDHKDDKVTVHACGHTFSVDHDRATLWSPTAALANLPGNLNMAGAIS